ncbi:MAG TPA: ABC transporter ATP-binding protein [Nitrospirae bacterium]|nr:ABC transporter ATP-binding protein [Nitrospirota bacterium]
MIETKNLTKVYKRGIESVYAVKDVTLSIKKGEFVSIVGQSGSGKTTLLQIIGCMDMATSGILKINDNEIQNSSNKTMTKLRRETFGFVFQQFYLMPGLTVYENMVMPLLFSRNKSDKAYVDSLIEIVGLKGKEYNLPSQISGGEMQRVAIARSLINKPQCILADEPTGNLDSSNSEKIFELFSRLNETGLTIIMVTHNQDLAKRTKRIIEIKDGAIR